MSGKQQKFERLLYIVIIAFTVIFLGFGIHFLSPAVAHANNYVDNQTCLQCHQSEGKDWQTSHHAWAMAHANAMSVVGDFNHSSFTFKHKTTQFFKRDNKFFINTEGPDGKNADFEVKYTLGVAPLQQYLIELQPGQLQDFTIAWDTQANHWFHLYPNENAPPGDVMHWTGAYQNANVMCIGCHTTNYNHSTWSADNVGCQACHGPGEHHVAWARAHQQGKNIPDPSGEHVGLTVNFKSNANMTIETCAMCHARRSELTAAPQPGQPLLDNYAPVLLTENLYYPDGQQHAEDYVYSSFLQSKMYNMGVTCTDCHNPHTAKLKFAGNAVCTQCHSPAGDKRFPTAAKLYDDPSHTFHPMGSSGAQCVSCHMPSRTYMQIHARPDHSIRIPRPDLSITLGTPNACNTCHTDKTPQWANEWIQKWYKHKRQAAQHYGEVFAAARVGKAGSELALMNLANDTAQAPIVRATALDLLSRYGAASVTTAIQATHDSNPLIRRAAVTSLEKIAVVERIASVAPLLNDPIRAVRTEAARVLASVPEANFNATQLSAYQHAIQEYISAQELSIAMPAANLNLAVIAENQHKLTQAEAYYLQALKIDPDFTPARLNLARLYSATQRNADAEKILSLGINRLPQQGDLQYSLGLLQAEENKLDQAVIALAHAAKLLPTRARVQYNYALALAQLGKENEAEQQLILTQRVEPNNPTYLFALVNFYVQHQAWQAALPWARKLAAQHPNDAQLQQFLEQIESRVVS